MLGIRFPLEEVQTDEVLRLETLSHILDMQDSYAVITLVHEANVFHSALVICIKWAILEVDFTRG